MVTAANGRWQKGNKELFFDILATMLERNGVTSSTGFIHLQQDLFYGPCQGIKIVLTADMLSN